MMQRFRLSRGGLIDRARPFEFRFNGRRLAGYAGDTLAAALLANGVHLVSRSFKYHRPRGIVCAGADEPNALVQLEAGDRTEPNVRATQLELYDGLTASSQNCWPSVNFDLGAVNDLLSPLMPAGFYYKTFMWPPSLWMTYERAIRRVAGMGRAPQATDPDLYAHRHAHCDVLVAGGGAAGLAAAVSAARTGARVILADEGSTFGGSLLYEPADIDGDSAASWVAQVVAELASLPGVVLLRRATVFGYFDHNALAIAEHLRQPDRRAPRQRLWKIRARQVVLATGSLERPLVFGNNDRPGVMLASAARAYVNRYAVRPGARAVVFTNNDSAYAAAFDLQRNEVDVAAIVDVRASPPRDLLQRAAQLRIECRAGAAVTRAHGARHVAGVEIAGIDARGTAERKRTTVHCDLLCMAGGWSPAVHLHSQAKGKVRYDERLAAFLPADTPQAARSVGAANGTFGLAACLSEGFAAGAAAAHAAGHGTGRPPPAPFTSPEHQTPPMPLWEVNAGMRDKSFVDLVSDVTSADIALAAREGYSSVEHLKRYTTLGMGPDQGKLSNINGLAILAQRLDVDVSEVGTTTFRPPYTPVTFGALAGQERGEQADPVRRSPMHAWHVAAGATLIDAGLWKRPRLYPRRGESEIDAINRETRTVRNHVGLVDVSTLGKIDIKGRDAVRLLDLIYINNWSNLAVGKVRYGAMLREDGMVLDDGTTARLSQEHYLMTTSTANASKVMATLEFWLQVEWRDLEVYLTWVTEHWAAMALAGPEARRVLEGLAPDQDWSNAALPFMSCASTEIGGIPARVFRISFSGELSYEINVPADYGQSLWEALLAAGEPYGIAPYGTEAMTVMRIEKGHVAGMEMDGRTTPGDLGLGALVSSRKDFIGKRSLKLPALNAADRRQLVGLVGIDEKTVIPCGAQLVADPQAPRTRILGHVTSTCWSPTLERPIALALLAGGRARHGTTLHAMAPLAGVSLPVKVTDSVFVDPEGLRARA